MSEITKEGAASPLSLTEAGEIVNRLGLMGFSDALEGYEFESTEQRNAHIRTLYDEAWGLINERIEATDDASKSPTERILDTVGTFADLRLNTDFVPSLIFATFLHSRQDDDPYTNYFEAGVSPEQQQRFDSRLVSLCNDALMTGETFQDPRYMASSVTAFLEMTIIWWSMNRDIPDLFTAEELKTKIQDRLQQPQE